MMKKYREIHKEGLRAKDKIKREEDKERFQNLDEAAQEEIRARARTYQKKSRAKKKMEKEAAKASKAAGDRGREEQPAMGYLVPEALGL